MTTTEHRDDEVAIAEQKRLALCCLTQAWGDAAAQGVDSDVLAHAALFAALSDLVTSYGEDAVAELASSLEGRIRNREFTLNQVIQ
jgi:hypothetical protein